MDVSEFSPIVFTGRANEYFTIWLANLLLSIITMGIYSAWAKVRRINYFYNNTRLEGVGLMYHANPKTILIGRILAVIVLVALNLVNTFVPIVGLFLLPVVIFALPWIMNRSMRFNARMTSWRNVRFQWHGTYWSTFMWMLIAPMLSLVSLGLLAPLMTKKSYQYYADKHSFGTSSFSSLSKKRSYYIAFVMGAFLPFLLLIALSAFLLLDIEMLMGGNVAEAMQLMSVQVNIAAFVIAFSIAAIIYNILARNIFINALVLDDKVVFKSDVSVRKIVWIMLSNLFAVIFTLGLMLPWAQIRLYKYLCFHTHYKTVGDIGGFIDGSSQQMGAFAEEIADLEGLEFGI